MRAHLLTALLVGAALAPSPSAANAQSLALTAAAGTRGVGGGAALRVTDRINVRANVHVLPYSHSETDVLDDIEVTFDADVNLVSGIAVIDWFAFSNAFRFTAGAVINGNSGSGTVIPREPLSVGARTYAPDELGILTGDVQLGSAVAPYLGIGLGNALTRRIGFLADVGVMYQGSPSVDLEATDLLEPTAAPDQEAQLEDNLSWAQFYPVVSIGLSVRLF
jgi:hypothetical protein